MCGIIGLVGTPADEDWRARRDQLADRGPDGAGEWSDPTVPVWLGHRRLAVQDLSDAGAQPMASPTGRYIITYNGEVYNAPHLRRELDDVCFRGHSDTEVLLAAVERWGVAGALERLDGMFAFGLWDRVRGELWLARDRLGIKPLVYAPRPGGGLAFASTLAPLRGLSWLDGGVEPAALASYFRWLNVPAPLTIVKGARKLPPGGMLRWRNGAWDEMRWWRIEDACLSSRRRPNLAMEEAAEELEALLGDVVGGQMLADVPLGVFLSGGIDSSTVAALMARGGRQVKSFSIGFADGSHDESRHAGRVAADLGIEHASLPFTAADMLALLPDVTASHDEPFADVGALPMRMLCAFAREHVTVALAGDGGDELFGGYPRYFWAGRIAAARRRLGLLASPLAACLVSLPSWVWDGPVDALSGGRYRGSDGLSRRVRRFAGYLATPEERVYDHLVSAWPQPPVVQDASGSGPDPACFGGLDWPERMMAADQASYLPDEVLTKVDRASMARSLEVRVPLLSHRVVEWAWTVPSSLKLTATGDRGKMVLREVLRRHVPDALVERPKMGFGVPLDGWLKGPLRGWAEALIDEAVSDPLLEGGAVRGAWDAFLHRRGPALPVWTVLAYRDWLTRVSYSAA